MGFVARRVIASAVFVAAASCLAMAAMTPQGDYRPAERRSGRLPEPPVNAAGWVEALVDVEVNAAGAVTHTTGLRATPDALDLILPSLATWTFAPAHDGESTVASHVLVAAMMRPAQIFDPAGGSPAAERRAADDQVPYPNGTTRPAYPANAVGSRSVLVEVAIGADGRVTRATVVGDASGFDTAALAAARSWTFRPARVGGRAVPGLAYLIFGFRAPVG